MTLSGGLSGNLQCDRIEPLVITLRVTSNQCLDVIRSCHG